MNAVVFGHYETVMKKQEIRVLVVGRDHADDTILKLLAFQQNITTNLVMVEERGEIAKYDAAPDTIIVLGADGKEMRRFKPDATMKEVGDWIVENKPKKPPDLPLPPIPSSSDALK